MEKSIITFSANEQALIKTGGIGCYASDTVSYIEAQFALGENWSGYDSVRAVWFNDYKTLVTVLNPNGICIVPHEVLVNRGKVMVNLVGSISVSGTLTDRLTTFPCEALKVSAKAKINGSETAPITPSQFEQFVSIVISEVEKVTGMTAQAETLPAGSQATARYEDGILYLGIPQGIRGERGETGADGADGNGIASVVYNADYSLTLVFDNGEQFTTPPIRGERGPAGADGRDGTDGADGVTPNLSIGNVTTLEPSEDAYVTRRGTDANPIFDFGIPKGDKGDTGTVPDLDLILPTDTASGDIVSITDGQNVVPVKSLKVTLEPIQSGSGTPSPDNVRPISGHTECVTEVCGKNLLDPQSKTEHNANTWRWHYSDGYVLKKNVAYNFSWGNKGNNSFNIYLYIADFDTGANYNTGNNSISYTPTEDIRVKFQAYYSGGIPTDAVFQLELGSSATSYEPYQGTSYTTTLGRTVYGGTLEQVGGQLTDNMGYIASYNGETIGEPWISDRDEYVAGTTPSIGAEVVYTLATPQTYQLDPQTISLLHGNNNVWSDGEVELTYNADVGLYIDKKLGTSGTRTLSMTTLAKSEETKTDDTETELKSVQLAED